MHTVILLDFIDVFCMYIGFLLLTYDTAYRCHMVVSLLCGPVHEGELKGIMPYHSLLNYTFSFNLLGVIFYTQVYEEVCL